jgi:hypothetical protein
MGAVLTMGDYCTVLTGSQTGYETGVGEGGRDAIQLTDDAPGMVEVSATRGMQRSDAVAGCGNNRPSWMKLMALFPIFCELISLIFLT